MPSNAGAVKVIAPKVSPVTVSVTNGYNGNVPVLYSDSALTTTVSQPITLAPAAVQSLYFASPGAFVLSVTYGSSGIETADVTNHATIKLDIQPGEVAVYDYTNVNYPVWTGVNDPTVPLRYFRSQLARRETSPCDIVYVGHSLVEGEGASTQFKRGTDRFRDVMRTKYPTTGVAGGYGHVSLRTLTTTWSQTLATFSGGATSSLYGFGLKAYFVNASGAKVNLAAITCTAVDVLYIQGGGGTFSTKTDGVANGDSRATTGSPIQMMKYRVPGITGAAASHTVEVDWTSGNSIIVGFIVYNGDETSGVRVHNDGLGGAFSSDMLDVNNRNFLDFATLAPSLVVVSALANDFKTGVSLATSKANLQSIVAYTRQTAPLASLVFSVEHALGATSATIPWASYAQIYYDVAAADGNIAVFDFYKRLGTSAPPTLPGIIYTDQQHYTDAGYLMWAEAFAEWLGRPR